MNIFKQCVLLLALVALTAANASAAGFATYEWGARGNALGGAMVARKTADPSSQAFNPALITEIEGTQIAMGFSTVTPAAEVDVNGETSHGLTNTWVLPHGYLTHEWEDDLWVGVGVFSRFGLGTEYEEDWPGRYNVHQATIQSSSFNPVMAYKINEEWSVAAGLEFTWFQFKKRQFLNIAAQDREILISGDSIAFAPNLGVTYKPADWVSFGASYRATQRHHVSGNLEVSNPLPGVLADGGAGGNITLPASYSFGVCFYPMEKLSVETGFVFTQWSSYDQFTIESDNAIDLASRSKYSDVWRLNIGVEYEYNDDWTLRTGYVFDESPLNKNHLDYMVPANDRHLFNFGAGYKIDEHWNVDGSYTYLHMEERNGMVGAQMAKFHDGNAHIFGLTVGYTF
ncbi:MAG: OmpP1/FadL family transporter [Desulfovibrio sp.]